MFKLTALTNDRFLVTGTDFAGSTSSTTLDGTEWIGLKKRFHAKTAANDADAQVRAFLAPLLNAAEAYDNALKDLDDQDPNAYILLEDGAPGTDEVSEVGVHLNTDSQILRLIEENDFERLVWVDDHNLAVTKYVPGVPLPTDDQLTLFDVEGGIGLPTK